MVFSFRVERCGAIRFTPSLLEVGIKPFALIGPIARQVFWFGFQPVEGETELHQGDFMIIRQIRVHRVRQPVTTQNRHVHDLAALGEPDALAAFVAASVASMKLSRSQWRRRHAACSQTA